MQKIFTLFISVLRDSHFETRLFPSLDSLRKLHNDLEMSRLCLIFSFAFLISLHAQSTVPVPYSGKVAIQGVNYYGTAEFVVSLQDSRGGVHWRKGNSEKDTIRVPIQNGRYTVLLGGQGMNPLPPQLFVDHNELYLKVLFDNGDGQGMRHLVPDQQITATPRALVAEIAKVANTAKVADSVKAGTITTAQLNEQIFKYLKPEITASPVLPQELLRFIRANPLPYLEVRRGNISLINGIEMDSPFPGRLENPFRFRMSMLASITGHTRSR